MQSLRLFCDVARHQSFSRAAKEHGITQSAASQRVSQLERRLGVQLFDRSVRPLALTPAGEVYFREGREILDRFDEVERRLSQFRPKLLGQITIDAIYSAGIDLLNHVRAAFESKHPGVTVNVQFKQPDDVYESVRHESCDLGIVSYPQTWRDVGVVPLRDERMAVVCSPGHPMASRKRIHATELANMEMATFGPELPAGRAIRRYLRDHGVTARVTSSFDNIDTVKTAVAVTSELSILPKRTVMREVAAGTLAVIELEPRLERPVGIIYRRRRTGNGPFSPTAQAFVDFLLENAGPNADLISPVQNPPESAPDGTKP